MTEFKSVVDALADTLGVGSSVVTTLLIVSLAIFLSLIVIRATGSVLHGALASSGMVLFGVFLGLIPLWVGILLVFVGVSSVLFTRFVGVEVGESSIVITIAKNTEDLILRIDKSSRNWSQYTNNLDSLLGIKTINDENPGSEYGLKLNEQRELYIHPGYDWYITEKHPSQDIFKIVGLHKEDDTKNLVYLLGRSQESGKPYLTKISKVYLEGDFEECLLSAVWSRTTGNLPLGEDSTSVSAVASILPIVFVAVIILGAVTWLSGKN